MIFPTITPSKEHYISDAYNALSIEGYRVTDELIERVARGH